MTKRAELAIVGAGILGLAHAYHAAKAGIKTTVFERNSEADGASVRNFGMLIGEFQSSPEEKHQAQFAEKIWQQLAIDAGFSFNRCGALLIATSEVEKSVLLSFNSSVSDTTTRWIEPNEFSDYSKLARSDLALGALWVPSVAKVDQRAACKKISQWLQTQGIEFVYDASVESINLPTIQTNRGSWQADRVIICAGDEFKALYPRALTNSKIRRCQLQMLRIEAQPNSIRNEPFILGGLSYSRYAAFQQCTSINTLKGELKHKFPEHIKHGVHVIAAQECDGTITIGDSHHYGSKITNQRIDEVDDLIIDYLQRLVKLPNPTIQSRWLGHYASLEGKQSLHLNVDDNVDLTTITSGQGMTLGFSVANDLMIKLGLFERTQSS